MAGGPEKSAGIPVIEVGVPTKKDRGDLYTKSLQEVVDLIEPSKGKESVGGPQFRKKADQANQKESPIDTFYENFQQEQRLSQLNLANPNPPREISLELWREITGKLSTAETQSLKYLKLKALNVQVAIEKVKGEHNSERGALVIKKEGKDFFSLTSFGQTTGFHYIKEGDSEKFSLIIPGSNVHNIVTHNPEGMIRLINFINFSKDFIKDNVHAIRTSWKGKMLGNIRMPFYEKNGKIECNNSAARDGSTKLLTSENNFFPQSTKEIVDYLNYFYRDMADIK